MQSTRNESLLWYERPAEAWEEALPIGNGRLGGMVFGTVKDERIALNEDTLWSGYPREPNRSNALQSLEEVRRLLFNREFSQAQRVAESTMLGPWTESYMPLGDLHILHEGVDNAEDYIRELDLDRAVATTTFRIGTAQHRREAFISAPDQVMVVHISCSEPENVTFIASLDSMLPHATSYGKCEDASLTLSGRCPSHVVPSYVEDVSEPIIYDVLGYEQSMTFAVRMDVLHSGGVSSMTDGSLSITKADSAWILLTAATSFNGHARSPVREGVDAAVRCATWIEEAKQKPSLKLLEEHVESHRRLFRRVVLALGASEQATLPTDQRIASFGSGERDIQLVELLFQYGRYLLISSSRPGTQPANLQGIWSHGIRPPWSSNWTTNINAEMNYWLAETCNLSECHEPLLDLVEDLRGPGSETARLCYGCRGWVVHHNVDLWRTTTAVGGSARWALWPMASVWLSLHAWEHYRFGQDLEYLEHKGYPAMRESARFLLDWLVENIDGNLVTCPSTSPENVFLTENGETCSIAVGTTMDMSLARELFTKCIEAANLLSVEDDFTRELRSALPRLLPFRIGRFGQLLEYSEEYEEPEPGHRHLSHLFSVYPGTQVTPTRTPVLADACRRSLERRGDAGTGWSLAWKVALWARLGDGDKAMKLIARMLTPVTTTLTDYKDGGGMYKSLLCAHPPFQIDGNFGVTSGIAEMLLQSHEDFIHLLPALPATWRDGFVEGLCARGGLRVDMSWTEGRLENVRLVSMSGGPCRIRYNGQESEVSLQAKKSFEWRI